MSEITATPATPAVNAFVQHFFGLVQDPTRTEKVFQLFDAIEASSPDGTIFPEALLQAPHVRMFLEQPYQPLYIDIEALSALPEGTLGRTLADWMISQGLSPDALRREPGDDPTARLKDHLSATHDVWHVVTGFNSDVAGEGGLQAFYQAQMGDGSPLAIMSVILLNTMIHDPEDSTRRMDAITHGWQMGKQARPLLGVDWAAMWEMPLHQVRQHFGLDVAEEARAAA